MADVGLHILIPYVGREDYLRTAVVSVLVQSDANWLLTVVEDGDQGGGAATWLRSLDDPRVEFVTNPHPLGIAGNFQRCLDLAQRAHIVILGCDDMLLPTYLARLSTEIEANPDAAALLPHVDVIDAHGVTSRTTTDWVKSRLAPRSSRTIVVRGEPALTSLLHGNWTYFPSICWRTEAISPWGFRPDLPTTLDLALLSRVLLVGGELVICAPPATFHYRRHQSSASSQSATTLDRFEEEQRLFAEIEESCRRRGWPRAARAARWHVTSRLHAATLLPDAVRPFDRPRVWQILRHVLGRTGPATPPASGPGG